MVLLSHQQICKVATCRVASKSPTNAGAGGEPRPTLLRSPEEAPMVERSYRLAAPPARGQEFDAEIQLEIRFRSNFRLALGNPLICMFRRLALSSIRCEAGEVR